MSDVCASPADQPTLSTTHSPTHALRGVLVIAALIVAAGGFIIAGMLTSLPNSPSQTGILAFVSILGGVLLGALLAAAASALGMLTALADRVKTTGAGGADDVRPALDRLEQSLRALNSLQSRPDSARALVDSSGMAQAAHAGAYVPNLLAQIHDLTLMDEEQRKRYAARHWALRKDAHLEAIEREVLVGDWPSAFARLEELQIVLPSDMQVADLRERVESEQAARLDEDARAARGRLRQLMAAGLWQQAEELAASLQTKYPGKAEADRLVEDVRRERDAWERATTDRLFSEITSANERRQWRQAVLAIEEFIRRYPLDPRSDALRLDLPTLKENAAAHERKEQEEQFKDLLKHQRYEEAIRVARGVIQKYPQSPTATELNKLLPRVEEMARQEAARVAAQQNVPADAAAV